MKRYPDVLPSLVEEARRRFLDDYCRPEFRGFFRDHILQSDRAAVRYGPMTGEVARRYGHPLDVTRRQLQRALRDGRVLVEPCRGGCSRWWPVGLVEQLRSEAAE